eukprot:scaffold62927_cov45-Phaeocystis_antarctica.AAC.1
MAKAALPDPSPSRSPSPSPSPDPNPNPNPNPNTPNAAGDLGAVRGADLGVAAGRLCDAVGVD